MGAGPQEHVTSASAVPAGAELLVERVLAGQAVSRSPRLRELLAFLCDWTLTRNGAPLTEEQIGVEVFGRQPRYDTTSDTIVRVQISQLRKKLEQHFQTEGANEPVVIELPKRTYAAVFRPRHTAPEALPEVPEPLPVSGRLPWILAVLLVIALAGCVWLAADNARLRRGYPGSPLSDALLRQAFGNGRSVQIVVSDGSALALNDFLDGLITPAEYRSSFPVQVLDRRSVAPDQRPALDRVAGMNLTTLQDVQVAGQMMQRTAALGIPTSIVYARDFRYQPQVPENLIFLGHRKANPWTTLFEERLNFQYAWDNSTRKASIVNRAPTAGEQAVYPVEFGVQSYAVVALLPKPGGEGSVLLLEGGDMGSPLAAAALICRDEMLAGLYTRLGVRPGTRMPWFEALIRTNLLGNVVHRSEIIAHRLK